MCSAQCWVSDRPRVALAAVNPRVPNTWSGTHWCGCLYLPAAPPSFPFLFSISTSISSRTLRLETEQQRRAPSHTARQRVPPDQHSELGPRRAAPDHPQQLLGRERQRRPRWAPWRMRRQPQRAPRRRWLVCLIVEAPLTGVFCFFQSFLYKLFLTIFPSKVFTQNTVPDHNIFILFLFFLF